MRVRAIRDLFLGAAALALVGGAAAPAGAQGRSITLFTLQDARGDDVGAGDLIYPDRPDYQQGDLDLVSLSAEMADGGTWFIAGFNGPVRDPADQRGEIGPERLDRVARHGFYTLNLDIYIDTDRKPGSGSTATVPGRGVQVDRRDAWEKAIILTPRPEIARTLMVGNAERVLEEQRRAQVGNVSGEDYRNIRQAVDQTVDQRYHFPTRVQVRQKEIRFFVPDAFLGGKANPAWAYTVFVTGANVQPRQRLLDMPFKDEAFAVMQQQAGPGRSAERFGIRSQGDPAQPAIVDVLTVDPGLQGRMLRDYDVVAGRLPRLVGVVPTGRGQSPWEPHRSPARVAGAAGAAGAAPEPRPFTPSERDATAALSGAPILAAPAADIPAAGTATGTGGLGLPTAGGERKTVAQRLRELTDLRQQNLITEEEYQDARRRVLSGL